MKQKFRTMFDSHNLKGESYENVESVTIPDKVYTIAEQLKRFTEGKSVSGFKNPELLNYQEENDDFIFSRNLDLADMDTTKRMLKQSKDNANRIGKELLTYQKQKKEKAQADQQQKNEE